MLRQSKRKENKKRDRLKQQQQQEVVHSHVLGRDRVVISNGSAFSVFCLTETRCSLNAMLKSPFAFHCLMWSITLDSKRRRFFVILCIAFTFFCFFFLRYFSF